MRRAILLCGLISMLFASSSEASPRIIKGEEASSGDFPGIVALVKRDNPFAYRGQFCAGVLLRPRWVVTAAHCVNKKSVRDVDVIAGRFNLAKKGGERIAVAAVRRHPLYNQKRLSYDFALLYLSRASKARVFPRFFSKVGKRVKPGRKLSVAGWGMTEYNTFPNHLLKADVRSFSDKRCQRIYPSFHESMFCAAGWGRDSCGGDSGGPIIAGKGRQKFLLGLVSWGRGCAEKGFPGVYGKLSFVKGWLEEVSGKKLKVRARKAGRERFPSDLPPDYGPLDYFEIFGPYEDDTYPETNYYSELFFWENAVFPLRKIVLSFTGAGIVCAPEYSDLCSRKRWTLTSEDNWQFAFYSEKKCFLYRAKIFTKNAPPFLYRGQSCS